MRGKPSNTDWQYRQIIRRHLNTLDTATLVQREKEAPGCRCGTCGACVARQILAERTVASIPTGEARP